MKTFYKCISCSRYSFHSDPCKECGSEMIRPYPARFSLVKEEKFRKLYKKLPESE